MRELLLDLAGIFLRAQLVNEDLYPGLVLVVPSPVPVVNPQAGFTICHQLVQRNERIDAGRDHRRTTHAPAHIERSPQLARIVLHDVDADVMQPHRRTIFFAGDDGNFKLARQVAEFRVETGPLTQQFRIGTRIDNLVRRRSCEMV